MPGGTRANSKPRLHLCVRGSHFSPQTCSVSQIGKPCTYVTCTGLSFVTPNRFSRTVFPWGGARASVIQNGTILRGMCMALPLGDSPCTLLVFIWLGEVVGASLARITDNAACLGTVASSSWQVVLEPSYQSLCRCSVGVPSQCGASLTCGPDLSGTRNRFDSPYGFLQRAGAASA